MKRERRSQPAVCIHGHFYQPPRENPWLEYIELQPSAAPFHDWNQRIAAECYRPNTGARILDAQDRLTRTVNNYSRISFNFGPTLLSWLETHDNETYAGILLADRESRARFGGHGSALAQTYNHTILPLASARDRRTQVAWGVRDFELRFGHRPEGMWLAETAVDTDSLEALAAEGLAFTILAPSQAARVRAIGSARWREVEARTLDTSMPYRVELPSGASMALFFYNGELAHAVAFGGLLSSGHEFARRLRGAATDRGGLVHIATDGETFGHHHRHGEMALAHALSLLESDGSMRLTNYGEHLERHPPTHEVAIVENSAWSCAHGVERWRSNCGCRADTGREAAQTWRAPLRQALDTLRDSLEQPWERAAGELFDAPWKVRDAYVECMVHRSEPAILDFLARHGRGTLTAARRSRALSLLELQRQLQFMYTSCGWFFDRVTGIETLQILCYAARALELARRLLGGDHEGPFLDRLGAIDGGRELFERHVRGTAVTPARVAANVAAGLLVQDRGLDRFDAGFRVVMKRAERHEVDSLTVVCGRMVLTTLQTLESTDLEYAFTDLGHGGVRGGVGPWRDDGAYSRLAAALAGGRPEAVVGALQEHLPGPLIDRESLLIDVKRGRG